MSQDSVGDIVNRLTGAQPAGDQPAGPAAGDRPSDPTAAAQPVAPAAAETLVGRARLLASLVPVLGASARRAGVRAVTGGRWLADEVVDLAPRLVFRDAQTLHRQYPRLTNEEIARKLISSAKLRTAGLGAAAGGLAAAEFVSLPTLLAAPVQLAAETLCVTAVELKLVAELHEVLGAPATGTQSAKAAAYLMAWVRRRALGDPAATAAAGELLGAAAKRELRTQLLRKVGRSTTSLAPFLAGAVAGAEVNRRATGSLGEAILGELLTRERDQWFRQL